MDFINNIEEELEGAINSATNFFNNLLDDTNVPNKINEPDTFYYILLDCHFNYRNKLGSPEFKGNYTGHIKDHIHKNNSNFIPIVYDLEDAKKIACKLINWIMNQGVTEDRKMPYFGALILALEKSPNTSIVDFTDDIKSSGEKHYDPIFLENINGKSKIVNYDIIKSDGRKIRRGIISKQAINESVLLSIRYGYQLNIPLNVGLYLLNSFSDLSDHEIKLLREILRKNGEEHLSDQSFINNQSQLLPLISNTAYNTNNINNINNMAFMNTETSEQEIMDNSVHHKGGKFENMYIAEKNKYVKLKQIAKSKGLI